MGWVDHRSLGQLVWLPAYVAPGFRLAGDVHTCAAMRTEFSFVDEDNAMLTNAAFGTGDLHST